MDYYQIRFTRLSDGWQTLKDFTNTPVSAIKSFSTFQSKNINPPSEEPIASMELLNDGRYVFNTRVWSNIGTDSSGRRIMFAHGCGMNLNAFVRDPGGLLSVGEDVFNNNANFGVKPIEIVKGNMELSVTLEGLGIDKDIYKVLYLNVYEILCGRMGRTLHVLRSSGWEWEEVKKCAFVILCALPYGLRKRFSFGTNQFPNGAKYTILFSNNSANADKSELRQYFDMDTGKSNLSDEKLRSIEHYGFVNTVTDCEFDTEKADAYYTELENKLIILRDETTASLDKYSLAADMVRYDRGMIHTEDELNPFLERLREIQCPGDRLKELTCELEDKLGLNHKEMLSEGHVSDQDKLSSIDNDELSAETQERQTGDVSGGQLPNVIECTTEAETEEAIEEQLKQYSEIESAEQSGIETIHNNAIPQEMEKEYSFKDYIKNKLNTKIEFPRINLRLLQLFKKVFEMLKGEES